MNQNETSYIVGLLKSNGKAKSQSRRVWNVDLEGIWLPFFTAANAQGHTAIPSEALGAPLRLGYGEDGSVRFTKSGKPQIKVVKEIADGVKLVRDNFIAGLQSFTVNVVKANPEGYKSQVKKAQEAGKPIVERDKANLKRAYELLEATAREAECRAQEPVKEPEKDKELVLAGAK